MKYRRIILCSIPTERASIWLDSERITMTLELQLEQETEIYTISRLNREVKSILEGSFPSIWVEGEISNLAAPASGHIYFTLKDAEAQIRCAMFRGQKSRLTFAPEHGMQVLVRAKVSLYEGRGDFQLIVDHMEEAGDGALQRAFNQLKDKLSKEGLFAEEHKQELPEFPECLGVITSPTGAAVRDILSVAERRFPSLPIIIYPTQVQGAEAHHQITAALELANQRNECDVLIVARGGGSLEDLWAFNEESVARAIFKSEIPVISGVGHDVDFTIADFVADHRSPTPSVAAEVATPDQEDLLETFFAYQNELYKHMRFEFEHKSHELKTLLQRLRHPKDIIQEKSQALDHTERALNMSMRNTLHTKQAELHEPKSLLIQQNPLNKLKLLSEQVSSMNQQLQSNVSHHLNTLKQQLNLLSRSLNTVSPLATLDRGYAILKNSAGKVVCDIKDTKVNENITARLANGSLVCEVKEINT